MNFWTEKSVEFAQQRNYLDELYKVYPISPNLQRELPPRLENQLKNAFDHRNNRELVERLLEWEVFPIKDSYVPFLKRDHAAIGRNPQTINRIAGNLYSMGFEDMIEKCIQPKETNRQMGPMFKTWIDQGTLGAPVYSDEDRVLNCRGNCIFNSSDRRMMDFAERYLGYSREKGLDFIAKFNGNYVVAEAKFLTDFGGHQNAQFDDAIRTMRTDFSQKRVQENVLPIAIMDGVLYIRGRNKLYKYLEGHPNLTIISALLLREYLYSL